MHQHIHRILALLSPRERRRGYLLLTTCATPSRASPQGASSFVDELKSIQSPVRDVLLSPENTTLSKEERRDLRAQDWEDKRRLT